MNICILLTGEVRSFASIKDSFINNFLQKLIEQNANIDIFANTNRPVNVPYLKDSIIRKKYKVGSELKREIQFQRTHDCYYNLVKPYMEKNNVDYDFFIKVRPDLIFFKNALVPIEYWSTENINVRVRGYPYDVTFFYMSYKQLHSGSLLPDDQIYIVPKKIVNKAFDIEYGPNIYDANQKIKNDWAEGLIAKLFMSHNLKYHLLPMNVIIHNWQWDRDKSQFNKRKSLELIDLTDFINKATLS